MITEQRAWELANGWVEAWNRHDLDAILAHYHPEVEFTSPFIVRLLDDPSGTLRGRDALKSYFERALKVYPDLRFELLQVLAGVNSVVLYYHSVQDLLAAEVMTLGEDGRVARVQAHYREGTLPSTDSG